ncbi:MAG: hypothetical protein DWQ47_15105 [Acidobacteria bacterium]|nr:MAG: hypothetical protein DWQ32_02505 [Acidobacteriota bacterium]REK02608.1 MAG: hypothetical protein DWQ38_09630 [Acidobacteriota bacterium]REK13589.1 MAG: hypothetical protein DWQ43_08195 [Acidobacteriota bacterium]REK41583.1 MAG: hypothetical protein DWQ47_15105 [Acidobacteriota bacterium]
MPQEQERAPVVALLTDFGTTDHFVAAVKGAVLGIEPCAVIVDVTHEIRPHDLRSAGFSLWACYKNFPKGTVFVCVVDPGVGSARRRIIFRTDQYQFVAPDNGLLSFVLDSENGTLFEITEGSYAADEISGTFDGRDVFGPVGAHLASGVAAEEIGRPIEEVVRHRTGLAGNDEMEGFEGAVIHIDRFGNLITNLKPEDLPAGASVSIAGTLIGERRRFFDDGESGGLFLIKGSTGLIEVASNGSSASDALGARVGDIVSIHLAEGGLGQ